MPDHLLNWSLLCLKYFDALLWIFISWQGMSIIQSTGTTVHLMTKIRDHRGCVYCDYGGPLSDINHLPTELNWAHKRETIGIIYWTLALDRPKPCVHYKVEKLRLDPLLINLAAHLIHICGNYANQCKSFVFTLEILRLNFGT